VENLEFLSDVVPRTMTMKQFKAKIAKGDVQGAKHDFALGKGQTTLDARVGSADASANGHHGDEMDVDGEDDEDDEGAEV
jgi:hypothetical protein